MHFLDPQSTKQRRKRHSADNIKNKTDSKNLETTMQKINITHYHRVARVSQALPDHEVQGGRKGPGAKEDRKETQVLWDRLE